MDALGDGNALIVGGAVRSAVLGEALADVDIATFLTPDQVTKACESAGLKVVPTGIDHGTVTVVADHQGFEVTTLRRDVATDGRRAVVAFSTDWTEDAQRRDFTMNTLLMDMKGQVYDVTGQGIDDLKNGVVRFVGDPDTRIAEDSLRILRFFRFHARYGKGDPLENAFSACTRGAGLIENLSRERVTQELVRLFPAKGSGASIQSMIDGGILSGLWSSCFNQNVYATLYVTAVNAQFSSFETSLFAYSIYEPEFEKTDQKFSKYLSLSNRQKDYMTQCFKFIEDHSDSHENNLYLFGQDVTLVGMLLFNAIKRKCTDPSALTALLEEIRQIPVPALPVKAGDVMSVAHLSQGKEVGVLLKKVEAFWLSRNTKPDKQECLDYVKTLL